MGGWPAHLALVLALLASASRGLAAQSVEAERWRFTFTPYVWMSGLEGTIGVGSNISEVGVEGLIGARYWNLGVDLSVPPQGVSAHRGWVDGTVGVNLRYQPGEKWRLVGKTDVGAGGSDVTWQLYGGAGYDLSRCCALVAAWRYLDVDYDKNDFVYDVQLSGPTFGVTLRF